MVKWPITPKIDYGPIFEKTAEIEPTHFQAALSTINTKLFTADKKDMKSKRERTGISTLALIQALIQTPNFLCAEPNA